MVRKTYGFGKKTDRISLSQFQLGTDLSRPTVIKTIKNLLLKNMLVKGPLLLYGIQKDWEKWVVNPPLLVKYTSKIGKGAFTKTGKGALTHKRKKKTKERLQPEVAFINSETYIQGMIDSKQRHIHIIGLFWKFQGVKFDNKEQAASLLPKQLKPASDLVPFSDDLILATMQAVVNQDYITLWDLGTVLKYINQVKIERETNE